MQKCKQGRARQQYCGAAEPKCRAMQQSSGAEPEKTPAGQQITRASLQSCAEQRRRPGQHSRATAAGQRFPNYSVADFDLLPQILKLHLPLKFCFACAWVSHGLLPDAFSGHPTEIHRKKETGTAMLYAIATRILLLDWSFEDSRVQSD